MAGSEAMYVHLPGVAHVPIAAVNLALELERRGFTLRRDGGDLLVNPAARLTADDIASIRQWKFHVLAVLDYVAQQEARH